MTSHLTLLFYSSAVWNIVSVKLALVYHIYLEIRPKVVTDDEGLMGQLDGDLISQVSGKVSFGVRAWLQVNDVKCPPSSLRRSFFWP